MTRLADIEREALRTDLPLFAPGDTLKVMVRVREGDKERLQAFEGTPVTTLLVFGQDAAKLRQVAELVLNRTWRPMLAVTGADGLPTPANAGNVLRPKTQLVLSLRLPPTLDAPTAGRRMKELLEANPPYGAKVSYEYGQAATGWHAPQLAPWLEKSVDEASRRHYGQPAMWMGEGGTIPFMAMLGVKFPQAQFLITGVLGPHSNAHGPNEFLHIDYAKRLTACVADVLSAHAAR